MSVSMFCVRKEAWATSSRLSNPTLALQACLSEQPVGRRAKKGAGTEDPFQPCLCNWNRGSIMICHWKKSLCITLEACIQYNFTVCCQLWNKNQEQHLSGFKLNAKVYLVAEYCKEFELGSVELHNNTVGLKSGLYLRTEDLLELDQMWTIVLVALSFPILKHEGLPYFLLVWEALGSTPHDSEHEPSSKSLVSLW